MAHFDSSKTYIVEGKVKITQCYHDDPDRRHQSGIRLLNFLKTAFPKRLSETYIIEGFTLALLDGLVTPVDDEDKLGLYGHDILWIG